jgi:hypothetical protein
VSESELNHSPHQRLTLNALGMPRAFFFEAVGAIYLDMAYRERTSLPKGLIMQALVPGAMPLGGM